MRYCELDVGPQRLSHSIKAKISGTEFIQDEIMLTLILMTFIKTYTAAVLMLIADIFGNQM